MNTNFYNINTLKNIKISDMVRNNQLVSFNYYRAGNLWYKHNNNGFEFPVPIEDIGDATFSNTEKAIILMRYIRKHINTMIKELEK